MEEAVTFLARPVVVEEKLDGANVALWVADGRVEYALRSGPGAADRAGQLGPLRAWVGERSDELRLLLEGDLALYADWLYLTHTVAYERLPSYLIALDLRRPDGSFLTVDERTTACAEAQLSVPAELWRGVAGRVETVDRLVGPSRYGDAPAEGVVVRAVDVAEPRLAKLVRSGFDRLSDEVWAGGRPRNRLAGREASWR
jgi:ATP-dependent RNA circularization protein (DNA/RNA ligase family)